MESSKKTKIIWGVLISILTLVILLAVYQIGTIMGFRQARFACQWGERYGVMIGMPLHAPGSGPGGPILDFPRRGIPDANGANGIVISINGRSIVVKGDDGIEKTVIISSSTQMRKGGSDALSTDIVPEDRVVIFGAPDETGEIVAGFIRVFDHNLLK